MPPQLLVIDDDPDACLQMKRALTQDFEILVVQDRPRALTVFKKVDLLS
jgi:PleD family two-component response regulator